MKQESLTRKRIQYRLSWCVCLMAEGLGFYTLQRPEQEGNQYFFSIEYYLSSE
jgi:hypothetical protein